MRLLLALGALAVAACSDDPDARIIAPLPDTTVVASIELRMEGHQLSDTSQTKVYVDLEHYTGELIDNTLPADCEDCAFVISFAGAPIANGPHTIGVYFFAGDKQIATDAIPLVFQR